ncbi:hypothetical protein POM88_002309 [Heracleum sosnowskyi]|uniref:DUF4408 domain-containing protein n=1 Tax=Heracleum sosnowskyi TaxID=360622 RepID=A0AAD8JFV7_9APIA|nr:hypothetical protein POM88_002309 [Heracleum sosnowskyi]
MSVFYIKVEKASAILSFERLQNFKFLFRFIEICIVLFIISTFSTDYLTFYSRICGDLFTFFRSLFIEILNPASIFVIGNMIILILFSNYGHFSAQESERCDNNAVVYNKHFEFFEKNDDMIIKQGNHEIHEETNSSLDLCIPEVSKLQRSKSEVFKSYHDVDYSCQTVTKYYRKSVSYNNRVDAEMSGDEFRQMVEGFIARQQRSLRQQEEKDEFSANATFET